MLHWFKYFDQKIRQFLSKNVSIPSDQNMSQWAKCFNTPCCILLQFILSLIIEIQLILESVTRLARPISDHAHPKIWWSTLNLCEFVLTCKKTSYFIGFFWRYGWLKNLAIWSAENILIHIFLKYDICAATQQIK